MPEIEWVNHASFVVRHGDVSLISDPWLFGTAFDGGWALLSESRFKPDDFARVTHIWLSHEHPDHFSPASLRSIPDQYRQSITLLYHETPDGKVVQFGRDLGFRDVLELPTGGWFPLGVDFRVLCRPFPAHDSWMAIECDGMTLLNLNDCMVRTPREIASVSESVGRPISVLFTQFSYASWAGNRGDLAAQRTAAAHQLEYVSAQVNALRPAFTVPFASFVRFCHEENAYLNEGMNTVHAAVEHLRVATSTAPVVLYPGQRWAAGTPWDSSEALDLYAADYARRDESLTRASPVPIVRLRELARVFAESVARHHGLATIRALNAAGMLRPAHIYLADHQKAVALVLPDGIRASARAREECDVEMTSDAFAHIMENLWGGNTLLVNGRYQAPPGGDFERFRRYAALSDMANHGERVMDARRAARFVRRSLRLGTAGSG